MPRPMLLDVDTGVDDAIAIALASRLQQHQLVALTTVAGNVTVDHATENTRRVAAYMQLDVPIYRGMRAPLVRPLEDASAHHGQDGLGGWQVPSDPAPLADETAPEAIVRLVREHRDELTLVFVGPLTNLAVALNLDPRIAGWGPRLVIMGGAFWQPGNTTKDAEFNIFADPEAAAQVAGSGLPATWVGLDATYQARLDLEEWRSLAGATEPAARLIHAVMRRSFEDVGRPHIYLHDPLAVAVAEDAGTVTCDAGAVTVDISHAARARTRISERVGSETPALAARHVNQERFTEVFRLLHDRTAPRA